MSRPLNQFFLWVFLLGTAFALSADTIILRNGKKKTGDILHMDARSVTLQVDDFLQIKLHRAHIREIITNRASTYTVAEPETSATPSTMVREPTKPEGGVVEPSASTPAAKVGFRAPAPVLINRADFTPRTTDGGDSDGKLIGADGKPLSDHRVYARDSDYFAKKVRDGMIRTTKPEAVERLSALRYLANEISTVRHLKEDLDTGVMLESRDRTEEKLRDTYERFRREAEVYKQKYGEDPLKAEEFPLAQWISQLVSAIRTYNLSRDLLMLQERLGMRDRVDLDSGNTRRGRLLRWRMKVAIRQMEQARDELMKRYRYFFDVGHLPEEPEAPRMQVWMVAHDEALLFPYKKLEGSPLTRGVRQDYEQLKITVGKPLLVESNQPVEFLQRKTIKLPAVRQGDEEIEVDVVEISIEDARSSRYGSTKANPPMNLRGWMLADRVQVVTR